MALISRLVPVAQGVVNYGNPRLQLVLQRLFMRDGGDETSSIDYGYFGVKRCASRITELGIMWYRRHYDTAACPICQADIVVDVVLRTGVLYALYCEAGRQFIL